MQDIVSTAFVVFLFVMYAGIALAFFVAGIRTWLGRSAPSRSAHRRRVESYQRVKSVTHEEKAS